MLSRHRRIFGLVLLAGLAVVGWVYRDTFASIAQKWFDDAAFSHGFLILPIALWLAYQKRAELAAVELQPSWAGLVALTGLVALWVVARGSGVLVIEQFAAVALLPAMLAAILGLRAAWCLAFPLAFLFFAVPFGRALVPFFMQVTADVATWALQISGIPVYRSHMFISIPAGSFEVARACSGLNYVIAGLVLGVLYAHVSYVGWRKRTLCVLAFLAVPILANGIRVYGTIAVSHLTDMRFGPGYEHVTFGRILFVLVILAMFWIGRRWRDDALQMGTPPLPPPTHAAAVVWVPVPLAILIVLAGPPYLAASVDDAQAQLVGIAGRLSLPLARSPWQGPEAGQQGWKPLYAGALAERSGVYAAGDGSRVDVFVGVYGLGRTAGSEMIAYGNRIAADEGKSLSDETSREIELPDGQPLTVRERSVSDAGDRRLVWYWFVVGNRPVASEFRVKALEAAAFIRRDADTERVVTISTPIDEGTDRRLQAFVDAFGTCLALGFATEACGG